MILGILAILLLLLLLCAVAQVFLYLMGLLAVVVVLRLTYNACRWAVRRQRAALGVSRQGERPLPGPRPVWTDQEVAP